MNILEFIFVDFLMIVLIAALTAIPTLLLWNWLIPLILGIKEITIWQAFGLNTLTGILFKTSYLRSIQ